MKNPLPESRRMAATDKIIQGAGLPVSAVRVVRVRAVGEPVKDVLSNGNKVSPSEL